MSAQYSQVDCWHVLTNVKEKSIWASDVRLSQQGKFLAGLSLQVKEQEKQGNPPWTLARVFATVFFWDRDHGQISYLLPGADPDCQPRPKHNGRAGYPHGGRQRMGEACLSQR